MAWGVGDALHGHGDSSRQGGDTEFTITTVSAQAHKVSSLGMSDALKMS